jgi:hypothetical protein
MKNTRTIAIGAFVILTWWIVTRRKLIATVTTSEGFDLSPYGGPTTYPDPIKRTATAIAYAEGFFVAGSIPQRAHNPGDLKLQDEPTLPGTAITQFSSDDAGWTALYRQLWLALTGQSAYYYPDMTIADMARQWTATQQDTWASNVANHLGVPVTTPIWNVLS